MCFCRISSCGSVVQQMHFLNETNDAVQLLRPQGQKRDGANICMMVVLEEQKRQTSCLHKPTNILPLSKLGLFTQWRAHLKPTWAGHLQRRCYKNHSCQEKCHKTGALLRYTWVLVSSNECLISFCAASFSSVKPPW